MTIWYPGYRQFRVAKTEANNLAQATIFSLRLARRELASVEQSDRFLTDVYPDVPFVQTVHRTCDDMSDLINRGLETLGHAEIPRILALLAELFVEAVELLETDSGIAVVDVPPNARRFAHLSDELIHVRGVAFTESYGLLLALLQHMRNRILHHGGTASRTTVDMWREMPRTAKALWARAAGRQFVPSVGRTIPLGPGEEVAAWAVAHRIANELNSELGRLVSRALWLDLLRGDFERTVSPPLGDVELQLRRMLGFSRHYYGDLAFTEVELRTRVPGAT